MGQAVRAGLIHRHTDGKTTVRASPAARCYAGPDKEQAINDKTLSETGWLREAGRRIGTHTLLKFLGTTGFMGMFFVVYFLLLYHPLFRVTTVPTTALDGWIAFQPWALALYASLWIYVSLPPALMDDRPQLLSYLWAATALSLVAMAVFLFWPTATPRPNINWALHPSFSFLKSVDRTRNACPSLHAAFAVFSAFWLERLLRQMGAGVTVRMLSILWCVAILYSTLATRQHVALDLYAGILLGTVGFALHMKFLPRPEASSVGQCRQPGWPAHDSQSRSPGE